MTRTTARRAAGFFPVLSLSCCMHFISSVLPPHPQVRIMKTRKSLDHQKLVLEATTQLMRHFKPDPKQIKKRIEDLIAREYLERDPSNPNYYKYLA